MNKNFQIRGNYAEKVIQKYLNLTNANKKSGPRKWDGFTNNGTPVEIKSTNIIGYNFPSWGEFTGFGHLENDFIYLSIFYNDKILKILQNPLLIPYKKWNDIFNDIVDSVKEVIQENRRYFRLNKKLSPDFLLDKEYLYQERDKNPYIYFTLKGLGQNLDHHPGKIQIRAQGGLSEKGWNKILPYCQVLTNINGIGIGKGDEIQL
jgi:hypothetical protein